MMHITREEAMKGLIDFGRVEEMLTRIAGKIDLIELDRITPFAAPLFLQVGRVPIKGMAEEKVLATETARLMAAAGLT